VAPFLQTLASAGHDSIVQELIGAGADVNRFVAWLVPVLPDLNHLQGEMIKELPHCLYFSLSFDVRQALNLATFTGITQLPNLA
jgi:hypothetical protein